MSPRRELMKTITTLISKAKMSASYEERFTYLENIAVLSDILKDVTMFENGLFMELDVD
jgi:hypothetical protein